MTDRPTKEIVDGIDNVIRFLHFHKRKRLRHCLSMSIQFIKRCGSTAISVNSGTGCAIAIEII